MKKLFLINLFILLTAVKGLCQTPTVIQQAPAKSGISYETLTKFFQSSITTENGGGFDFKSTIFSTVNLFKNGRLDLSTYYNSSGGKFIRNFEYNLGIKKDKSGSFNVLNGGIKYAIVNNRDKSDHNFFNDFQAKELIIGQANAQADKIYGSEIHQITDPSKQKLASDIWTAATIKYKSSHDLNDLPKRIVELRDSLTQLQLGANQTDFYKDLQNQYNIISKKNDLRGLLTLSINPDYKWNQKQTDSLNITLSYLVGIGKNYKKPWYINVQISNIFLQDTISKKGLSRNMSKALVGINKVLVNTSQDDPLFEMELALEDSHIGGKVYTNEETNLFKADAVFRLHITKSLSFPITLKYDLKKPDLLGIISLQWNLESK